jgi:hypothetical protein
MYPIERKELIDQLEHEAELALDAEPHNMELHFAVARFYRAAAMDVPEMLSLARDYTERGIELGPNTASATQALEQQIEAEADFSPIS